MNDASPGFGPLRTSYLLDALLGLGLFVLGLGYMEVNAETMALPFDWAQPPPYAVSVALVALCTLPLALRRRFPLALLVVSVTALCAARFLLVPEYQVTSIGLFFFLVAAGNHGAAQWRSLARAASAIALAVTLGWGIWHERHFIDEGFVTERAWAIGSAAGLAFNVVFLVGGWVMGELLRRQRERRLELEAANAELAEQQHRLAQQAVVSERVRIAREIHDVVAHHVSVMGVQAGAARRVLTKDPEAATPALESIEHSSREAVRELQQLLTFLRGEGSPTEAGEVTPGETAPASPPTNDPLPGLDRLDELRAQVAAAGLAVRLRTEGDPVRLAPTLDLSAYRIVQEALTNVRKHAHTEEADVTIDYGEHELTITVADRGVGPRRPEGRRRDGGNGLTGIRERVSLHKGRLETGPGPEGGFVLTAVLPYEATLALVGER